MNSARVALLKDTQEQVFSEELERLHVGERVHKKWSLWKLSPMLADDGLMNVKGRLQNSELSFDE